jgi:division/cell wall cluster transcriptional repressor MraZ
MASRKTLLAWTGLGCVVGLATTVSITWLIERGKTIQSNYLSPPATRVATASEKAYMTALVDAKTRGLNAPVRQPSKPAEVNDPAPLPPPLPGLTQAEKPVEPATHQSAKGSEPPAEPQVAVPVSVPTVAPAPLPAPVAPLSISSSPPPPVPTGVSLAEPTAIPQPAPSANLPAPAIPPPLPNQSSVPPPLDELKPVPPAPTGEPLPPLAAKAVELPPSPAPALPSEPRILPMPAGAVPPQTRDLPTWQHPATPMPAEATPAVMPVSLSTPAQPMSTVQDPAGTPLPPIETMAPLPVSKASTEPPLAPAPGPVQNYQVRAGGETMRDIAKHTLGGENRWAEVHRLNPALQADQVIDEGAQVRLPADACVHEDSTVQPLPAMWPKATPQKAKAVLPLTGTFTVNLDDKHGMLLPRVIRDQLGDCATVLLSPGSDQCLWLTNQTHLDRLSERLERSPAHEMDVRTFRRLYFAQTEKASVGEDNRLTVPDRLTQFAGLRQEVILVGIDDHFEVWDAASWRRYTQQKSAATRAAMAERN